MQYDVIIVGAGPAGSVAAMYLGEAGKKVLLVDKTEFPREKICGDGKGLKAQNIIKELGIYDEYLKLEGKKIYGVTLSSPNGTVVEFDAETRDKPAPGHTHKRIVFDNFLFQNAKKKVKEFRILNVIDLIIEDDVVKGLIGTNNKGEREEHRANIVLAADGANSIIANKLKLNVIPPEHFIVALRGYYKNVKGTTDRIEIHLVKNLIPGYFWIFPLPNDEANVGLGMVVKDMKKKNIDLKEAFLKEIRENPIFIKRFEDAELVGEIKGWNLPLASYHRKCYGNGFLLLGDAAALIDPLSGEGVGSAMISGKIAAQIAIESMEKNDFSEKFLKEYDKRLWEILGHDFETSYKIQTTAKRFPFLVDKMMIKASKDERFKKRVEELLPYTGGRKVIASDEFIEDLKKMEV
jgi:geranylgeranyl reductase family protein